MRKTIQLCTLLVVCAVLIGCGSERHVAVQKEAFFEITKILYHFNRIQKDDAVAAEKTPIMNSYERLKLLKQYKDGLSPLSKNEKAKLETKYAPIFTSLKPKLDNEIRRISSMKNDGAAVAEPAVFFRTNFMSFR